MRHSLTCYSVDYNQAQYNYYEHEIALQHISQKIQRLTQSDLRNQHRNEHRL